MRIIASFLLCFLLTGAYAQKLSGQWSGSFATTGDVWGDRTEYVLELDVNGNSVSGFSYTYFIIAGKRYYVICKLRGDYESGSKTVTVTEVDKVKSNTPPDFKDMFQVHALTYFKSGDTEKLSGKWKSTNPPGSPWAGTTELERKALVKVSPKPAGPVAKAPGTDAPKAPAAKSGAPDTKTPSTGSKPVTKSPPPATRNSAPAANTTIVPKKTGTTAANIPPKKTTGPQNQKVISGNTAGTSKKPENIDNTLPNIEKPKAPASINAPVNKIETRSKQVIKTIDVNARTFRVDMYDNGQIDGDTISLFFNGKLMVSRQRLSTEPISVNITLDPGVDVNELVMYAENLGSIPPNTALMVVTVGDKRYEVNITSSEQTSGTVRFRYRE